MCNGTHQELTKIAAVQLGALVLHALLKLICGDGPAVVLVNGLHTAISPQQLMVAEVAAVLNTGPVLQAVLPLLQTL